MSLFSMSGLVLKWLLRKPYTRRYPFEPRQPIPGSRGALAIDLPTCILRCISCNYCVENCPKKCLALTTAHGVPTVTRDREVFQQAAAPAPATK